MVKVQYFQIGLLNLGRRRVSSDQVSSFKGARCSQNIGNTFFRRLHGLRRFKTGLTTISNHRQSMIDVKRDREDKERKIFITMDTELMIGSLQVWELLF
jgi:hypothetical protein